MNIKEYFKNKRNVAWVTAVLILIAILTICVATSHSKYVLEKEMTFSLGIIESDEWNKRTLITGEELNGILTSTGATQVVFGYEGDFSTEIEGRESTAVGTVDEAKSFAAEDIKLYAVTDDENNITTAYILSEYQIKANANSSKMFYENETLTNIFFLNFETSIVENMDSMFYGCKNLTELDLSKFETPKLTNIANMFYDDILLKTIYVSELWNLSEITIVQENVFYNCTELVGGNGTTYNEENPIITSDYARIDRAAEGETPAIPGYFTYKSIETEEQITFNFVRPNVTENTTTTNTSTSTNTTTSNENETTTPSDSSNEVNTNKDDTKNERGTETETETEINTKTDTSTNTDNNDTDTNTNENTNTDNNGDTSLDDNTDNNDSNKEDEESEKNKEKTDPVEDEETVENVEDEKGEDTTEENVEDNETENTITE